MYLKFLEGSGTRAILVLLTVVVLSIGVLWAPIGADKERMPVSVEKKDFRSLNYSATASGTRGTFSWNYTSYREGVRLTEKMYFGDSVYIQTSNVTVPEDRYNKYNLYRKYPNGTTRQYLGESWFIDFNTYAREIFLIDDRYIEGKWARSTYMGEPVINTSLTDISGFDRSEDMKVYSEEVLIHEETGLMLYMDWKARYLGQNVTSRFQVSNLEYEKWRRSN